MSVTFLSIRTIASIVAATAVVAATAPPAARVLPYTQTFYGTERSDSYHWMEAGGSELTSYLEEQTAYTESLLRRNPGRAKVRRAIERAYSTADSVTSTNGVTRVGSRVYYSQTMPGDNAPSILVRADGKNASSVVVAATRLAKGSVIGWFVPSPSGTKIAYGATESSEYVVVHVCNADGSGDTAQAIDASVIPFAVWYGERAFYYPSVRASANDRIDVSYFHVVGAKRGSDALVSGYEANGPLGSRSERHLFTNYTVLDDAVVATVNIETTPYETVFIAPFARATRASAPWRRLFARDERIVAVAVSGAYAYGLTDRGSARRSIVIRNRATGATVRTIGPSRGYRSMLFANRTGLYVAQRLGAQMRLERFDAAGNALGTVALPSANAIAAIVGDPATSSFAVQTASFDRAARWYDVGLKAAVRISSVNEPIPSIYRRLRHADAFAKSADGTEIPYTLVYDVATRRDGNRPTIVIGYGAYGYDIEPPVPPEDVALVQLGVVLVVVHVRGGGEFGEPWHLAGKGRTKQHTIDDFVACARAAIATGWTKSAKLAGEGGSAGGITIGGAITQQPGLFAVALSDVGFSDMVDLENMPNGPGNVPEFGSVKTRDGYRNLYAMSAYDHVRPAPYPATMFATGLNDQRNAPWQAAKMTARMRAATTSGKPVLLRADEQGHGVVLDAAAQVEQYTDEFTFMLWQTHEPGFTMN